MSAPLQPNRLPETVYRRRRIVVGAIALLTTIALLWGGGYVIVTLTRPLAAAAITSTQATEYVGPAAELALPSIGRMALAADGFDGLIASSGDQGAAPIASITKIVTALVILDAKPIDAGTDGPSITFSDADVQILRDIIAQNGSNAPVSAGLELTEREALTVLLLPSANNYAISLTNWAFGSTESFVAAAGRWLSEHQLNDTKIVEPSGLSVLNVSTPADLVALGRLAEADPVIADIVDDESADIPGVGRVENTNTLLGQAGIVGIKTGTTDEAGSCLLFAARVQVGSREVLLVGALLGGQTHDSVDADVLSLVETATNAFQEVSVTTAGSQIGIAQTAWGESSPLLTANDLTILAFGDRPVSIELQAAGLTAAAGGTSAGTLIATTGNQTVQTDVLLANTLHAPSPFWRLGHANLLG